MRTIAIAVSITLPLLCCCGHSPELTEEQEQSGQARSALVATAAAATVPTQRHGAAFVHRFESSKFSLGTRTRDLDEHGMHKFLGDQGVYATFPSGMVLALANANASVMKNAAPLPGGADAHNRAVHDYFVGAGLPESQIASVEIFPVMMGPVAQTGPATSKLRLSHYNSLIKRKIHDIEVPDSYAWARFNENGAVVNESVYWPEISDSVVSDAQKFSAHLASQAGQAYRTSLPTSEEGKLVIHHTPGEWGHGFAAIALYDVAVNKPLGSKIHYDVNGQPVALPHELKSDAKF
jgi:hypothetical protein